VPDEHGALSGTRVVELGYAASAPWLGRMLGAHGADVIKVETQARPELLRTPPLRNNQPTGAVYPEFAARKKHVAVNLKDPDGREAMLTLLDWADVFIENYRPGVLEGLGLDYEHLHRRHPRLIMASLPALSHRGPYARFSAYGVTAQAYGGINAITGYPGEAPMNTGVSLPDYIAALTTLAALAAAMLERRQSGLGQWIEVPLVDSAVSILGPAVLDASVNGRGQLPAGNHHRSAAPHGAYPCLGDDRWIAIACYDQAEWEGLVGVLNSRELGDDPRFATPASRLTHVDALDEAVGSRTRGWQPDQLVDRLGDAGVPAAVVARADDILHDPHLVERGYFLESDWSPFQPLERYPSFPVPVRLSDTSPMFGAPTELGADNRTVFVDMLGMAPDEFDRLTASGALT